MKPLFTYESGPQKGRTETFETDRVCIGRGGENHLVIPAEASVVSRRQAEIFLHDGRYWIEDCNSKHGTYVNRERVSVMQMLSRDDVIRFGQTGPSLRFSWVE